VFSRVYLAASLYLLLPSCQRTAAPASPAGLTRYCLLPFENLSGDPSLDWLAGAIPQAVAWQWSTSPRVAVSVVANTPAAVQAGAQRVVRGTLVKHRDGQLRLDAWVENFPQHRQAEPRGIALRADTVLAAANQVAALLGAVPAPYATQNAAAFRALVQAREQTDPEAAREHYRVALAADGKFSLAYLALAEFELSQGQREAALRTLADFRAQVPEAPPGERAQARWLDARAKNDALASVAALTERAAAAPGNAGLQRLAGAAAFAALQYRDSATAWQRLAGMEPANPDVWNQLAYARAAARDFDGARAAIRSAVALVPGEPHLADSVAEVEYQAGRFAEAAAQFEQIAATPQGAAVPIVQAAWGKAAYARLMSGDLKAADANFEKALVARKLTGVAAAIARSTWLFQSGRRPQAFAALAVPAGALAADKAAVATQNCLLHAGAGDWARARQASAGVASLCGFLALPEASETEWARRAEAAVPGAANAAVRGRILGMALALRGHPAAAIAPLREALAVAALAGNSNSEAVAETRILLGRCYLATQKWDGARDMIEPWSVPPSDQLVASPLFFPGQIEWRAGLERHYERVAEYERWRALGRTLTGGP